ncbi:MAG: TlpA family protein disulfide reductase [Candidatus Latescibacteria bacterium]|nr:TlpA family protein disulfide reductase [Candidatus Latescibacterota bacterium]
MLKNWLVCLAVVLGAIVIGTLVFQDENLKDIKTERENEEKESILELGVLAPEFQLTTLGEEKRSLLDYRGRFLLINFWATWCSACNEEIKYLQKAYQDMDSEKLSFLTISLDHNRRALEYFIQKNGYTVPVLYSQQKVIDDYRCHIIPATYLIDPAGKIVYRKLGFKKGDIAELDRTLKTIVEGKNLIHLSTALKQKF